MHFGSFSPQVIIQLAMFLNSYLPAFFSHNISHMEKELQNHIYFTLRKGKPCTINQFIEKFSCFKPSEFVEMFISIYKCDRNQNYDLLCHIVVANDEQMRSQMERYSNIQKGVLVENSNHFTTHQFKREHVRQLKILAIFPKQLLISDIQPLLERQPLAKTQQYVNKFVLVPKLLVQGTGLVKNKSKKEDKKQQKSTQPGKIQSQQPVQQKKGIKKTQSKSSMQIEQKPQTSMAPLKKVTLKEQPVAKPVLTSYAEQRSRVEQEIQVKAPQNKKLNLDSDEEYYNVNPAIFSQQLKSKTEQETDHSAVKADLEGEKMDIEGQGKKEKTSNISKFIVDDDDDDDDQFMRQIAAKKQKQAEQERQSSTQPKKESTPVPPLAIKKVEPIKTAPPVKTQAPAPVTSKAPASLMGWLKKG